MGKIIFMAKNVGKYIDAFHFKNYPKYTVPVN